MKFKPSYWFYIIFAVCFAGFSYLEDTVRAHYTGESTLVIYVLGFIPNYLPAIGLPCLFYVIIPSFVSKDHPLLSSKYIHLFVLAFSQFGLIAWEVAQIVLPRGTFDPHDILWTMIGGLTFYGLWKLHHRKYGSLAEFE